MDKKKKMMMVIPMMQIVLCVVWWLTMLPFSSTAPFASSHPYHTFPANKGNEQASKPIGVTTDAKFDPYSDNAGTTLALAGKDFCILAADTRLSDNYMIRSRGICRICEVNEGLMFTGSGCWSDILELSKVLHMEAKKYQHATKKPMNTKVLSHVISSILYSRRFFPYYTFSTIGGIDSDGHGAVFHYDALGSGQRVRAVCAGRGEKMMQPLLDELTKVEADESLWELSESGVEFVSVDQDIYVPLTAEESVEVIRKAFHAAAERETSIGDGLDVWILRRAAAHPASSIDNEAGSKFEIEKMRITLPRH